MKNQTIDCSHHQIELYIYLSFKNEFLQMISILNLFPILISLLIDIIYFHDSINMNLSFSKQFQSYHEFQQKIHVFE